MRSLLPILWSDDVFASARELWENAQSFGLRVGWTQSSHDANGAAGMLTLAHSDDALSRRAAEGKTSSEVSEILGISERTVNFHINNTVAKN